MIHQFETVKYEPYDVVNLDLMFLIYDHMNKCLLIFIDPASIPDNMFNTPSTKIISMLAVKAHEVWLAIWQGSVDPESNRWDLVVNKYLVKCSWHKTLSFIIQTSNYFR